MFFTWLFAVRTSFYSAVDVAWSYGIGLIAALYGAVGPGLQSRRIMVAVLAGLWSLRLGTHLLTRLKAKFPEEDRRYTNLRTAWGKSTKRNFFWFFQFQALSQPILCIPLALAATSTSTLGATDFLAVIVSLVGVAGEAISDSQLKRFKLDVENAHRVCDVGLWRYSRHPNYFFEWVIWWGFACLGLLSSSGWASILAPVMMFILLNFVTGVPPAEAQSLKSKGDLYRKYQSQTSRFFPWFLKGA